MAVDSPEDQKLEIEREKLAISRARLAMAERALSHRIKMEEAAQAQSSAPRVSTPDPGAKRPWEYPIVLAILAAVVTAIGSCMVAIINGKLSRDLEDRKSEAALILKMVDTGNNTERAAQNLEFVLKAGLINDAQRRKALEDFLKARAPGEGPATLSSASVAAPQLSVKQLNWDGVPKGSELRVRVSEGPWDANARVIDGAQTIATFSGEELKGGMSTAIDSESLLVQINLGFIGSGEAEIRAEVFLPGGASGGDPRTISVPGRQGDVTRVLLTISGGKAPDASRE